MLPFEYDVVQKVKKVNIKIVRDFDVENISVKLWNEHDLDQKVKKVRQRSTSNLSEILMWRISL